MNELRELARAREILAQAQERMCIAEHELDVSELGQRMAEIAMDITRAKTFVGDWDSAVRGKALALTDAHEALPDGVKVRQVRRVTWDDENALIAWCRANMPIALKIVLDAEMIKRLAASETDAPIKVFFEPQVMIARDLSGLLNE